MRLVQRDPNTAYISTWLWVPKKFTNVESVRSALSFQFTDSYAEGKVRLLYLWKESDHHILVPRHFWDVNALPFRVVDLRPQSYPHADITSRIKLDHRMREVNGQKVLVPDGNDVQQRSMDALLPAMGGTLQLACGKGKTCIALDLAARKKVPTLIVLPDTSLLEQWTIDIETLLNVPGGLGLIQGARNDWKKSIVLTTYHTMGARADNLPEEIRRWFGLVIWDEGHHVPAPTFAASAECFYGTRLSLTATPERDDGMHIISQYHIGPVLYKDLTPVQKPRIFFKWTGLKIDETRPDADVRDVNGEIHGSKVASYNAKWNERRLDILTDAAYAVQCGRKVLVLSASEAEIANMAAMWHANDLTMHPKVPLYTDIPIPAPMDVGETLMPSELDDRQYEQAIKQCFKLRGTVVKIPGMHPTYVAHATTWASLVKQTGASAAQTKKDAKKAAELDLTLRHLMLGMLEPPSGLTPTQAAALHDLHRLEQVLKGHEVHRKIVAELERRQKAYIKDLYTKLHNCGMMVYKVPAKERKRFIDTMPIVFAITKYGKEGLNSEELDTILVSSIFSSRNGLQQLNGRNTRDFVGKMSPVTVFYEDDVGHIIGMCKKLKKHLREWSADEGGPYEFEQIGHPNSIHRSGTWQANMQTIFGH